jgi:hypothetical protein
MQAPTSGSARGGVGAESLFTQRRRRGILGSSLPARKRFEKGQKRRTPLKIHQEFIAICFPYACADREGQRKIVSHRWRAHTEMFTIDSLRSREAKLVIAALMALLLALMLLALMLLVVPARPAQACLFTTNPGTDSFAAARSLVDSETCGRPGAPTRGNTSGATMEVGEPRPSSSTKDCGIFGISNSVWWKVTAP